MLAGTSYSLCRQTPQCFAPLCCVKGQPPSVLDAINRISEAARVLQFVWTSSCIAEEAHAERLRAAFARLEEVKQAVGRIGYAALSRRLPFSNDDEWELSELRELLDRD